MHIVISVANSDNEDAPVVTSLGSFASRAEANEKAYKEIYDLIMWKSGLNSIGRICDEFKTNENKIITDALLASDDPPPYRFGYLQEIEHLYRQFYCGTSEPLTFIYVLQI